MHNGTNITGDVTFSPNKNDLKIQNAQLTHNGVYTCIATADGLTDNQDISLIIVPGKACLHASCHCYHAKAWSPYTLDMAL